MDYLSYFRILFCAFWYENEKQPLKKFTRRLNNYSMCPPSNTPAKLIILGEEEEEKEFGNPMLPEFVNPLTPEDVQNNEVNFVEDEEDDNDGFMNDGVENFSQDYGNQEFDILHPVCETLEHYELFDEDQIPKPLDGCMYLVPVELEYKLGPDNEHQSEILHNWIDDTDEYYDSDVQFESTLFIYREHPIEDEDNKTFIHFFRAFMMRNNPLHYFRVIVPDNNFDEEEKFHGLEDEHFVQPGASMLTTTEPWWLFTYSVTIPTDNPKFQTIAMYHYIRYKLIHLIRLCGHQLPRLLPGQTSPINNPEFKYFMPDQDYCLQVILKVSVNFSDKFVFIIKSRSLNAAKMLHHVYNNELDAELTQLYANVDIQIQMDQDLAYMQYRGFLRNPYNYYIQGPVIFN